jgi:tetratricopeptide (TPR) repeat protein
MLGQAWQVSAEVERAIPVFEDAADKSEEGDIYARLAQLYLDRDDHSQAIRAADLAFEKGGLRNPGDIYVVKGMSLFELDRLDQALDAFRNAQRIARREDDRVGQNIARQWLSYVESESERRRRLREASGPAAGG